MANSPFRLEKRFGTTVRKTLPFTAEADGFIVLILQGSGQQYAIVSGGRRVNVYDGYEERNVFPVVKGEKIALSSKSSGGSLYVDYMPIEGGVIAKLLRAVSHRWRHDFSDESTDYISNGIRNNRNRALWRLVFWGCTNTTELWKNDRILYFKSERKCSCDSNTIRFYKGSNKYDYEPKISGGNFCVPVELLTAIPERGCA